MKNVLTLLILTIFSLITQAQDRTPIYVHGYGLNSNESFWYYHQNTLNGKFQLEYGTNNAYNSSNGVQLMANDVNQALPAYNRTIMLGYDIGGLVARQIDNTFPNAPVGGYITISSPLNGAKIYNNMANGNARNFINDGFDKIKSGPSQVTSDGAVTSGAWSLVNDVDHFLRQYSVYQNGSSTQTELDLQEGSSYINGSSVYNANKPIVHMYCNESSPVLWRTVGATLDFATEVSNAQNAAAYYQGKKDLYNTLGWASIAVGGSYWLYVASLYGDGCDWLSSGAENSWNDLIGSSTPAWYQNCYYMYDVSRYDECANGYGAYWDSVDCYSYANVYVCDDFYSPVNGQSDGFSKAPSQTGFGTHWSSSAVSVEMLTTNHGNIGGNAAPGKSQFLERIRDVFVGNTNANSFFLTSPR